MMMPTLEPAAPSVRQRSLIAVLLCSASALSPPPALAAIEEIVVTAQKRTESVQDVPFSIAAYSGAELEAAGIRTLEELSIRAPSFRIDSTNTLRNSSVSIRGIGSSGTNVGIDSSVGVFLDGVYMPLAAATQSDLMDIQTVEILRGPQGTLYGRNTPVGAVNIVTRRPELTSNGRVSVGYGDYDEVNLKGYYNAALGERAAGRLSIWSRSRDGYQDNVFTGSDVNDYESQGARARIYVEAAPQLDLDLIGYYGKVRVRGGVSEQLRVDEPRGIATPGFLAAAAAIGAPFTNFRDDDHQLDADDVGDEETRSYGGSATATYSFSGGHTLTSLTAWDRFVDEVSRFVADALPQAVIDNRTSPQETSTRVISQELRLASPTGGFVEYLGGVFLFEQKSDVAGIVTLGPGANRPFGPAGRAVGSAITQFDQTTSAAALFGSLTVNLTSDWRVTGGLRYSYDDKEAFISHTTANGNAALNLPFPTNVIGDVERDESQITWSVNTRYQFSDDVMGFVGIATGHKTGGFNSARVPAGTPVEFDAEESINYEVGIKSFWLDRRVLLNATLFHMELEDFQEAVLNPVTGAGFIVGNAGTREVRGLEADFTLLPIEPLEISGSVGYLSAEFTDYPNGTCYAGRPPNGSQPGTCSFDGQTPSFNPRWKYSLATTWSQPIEGSGLEWFARAEMVYTDEHNQIGNLDPRGYQEDITLYNARLGLRSSDGRWSVIAWGKNLSDEAYFNQRAAQPLNAFVSAGGFAAVQGTSGWYAPPRTWGLEASLSF